MPSKGEGNSQMSREEYDALVERMVAMQLKQEAELAMVDVDENGLECIDLATEDVGATSSRKMAAVE